MTQNKFSRLTKAQLAAAEQAVRSLASRDGIGLTVWSPARASMRLWDLTDLDLLFAMRRVSAADYQLWGQLIRLIGHGIDADEHHLEITCSAHTELMTLEVFAVRLL